MKIKKRWVVLLLLLAIIIIVLATCGKKGLAPGKYDVTQAVHELKDDDYELEVKNYGEYDVDKLTVVTDPNLNNMVLEIKQDKSHTLYVKSENDIIIEADTDTKKKKKKR